MAKQHQNLENMNLTQEQMVMAANAIKNAQDIICSCGSNVFTEGMKLKKVSRLLTGEDRDKILPLPILMCCKCLKELDLEEEKPAENNEIVIDFKR